MVHMMKYNVILHKDSAGVLINMDRNLMEWGLPDYWFVLLMVRIFTHTRLVCVGIKAEILCKINWYNYKACTVELCIWVYTVAQKGQTQINIQNTPQSSKHKSVAWRWTRQILPRETENCLRFGTPDTEKITDHDHMVSTSHFIAICSL